MKHANTLSYVRYVYELKELTKQIEKLRSYMFKIKEGKSYTDPEVVAASQELDAVLDKYQEMRFNGLSITYQNTLKSALLQALGRHNNKPYVPAGTNTPFCYYYGYKRTSCLSL